MSDLRTDLRNYLQRDFTDDVVIELIAAREQLAVAAALEQAAQFVEANSPYLPGTGSVGKPMADHIRALIPPEGSDWLREHDDQKAV